jgi:peptidoglycan/LPS O-acetylase OafA/YrhL
MGPTFFSLSDREAMTGKHSSGFDCLRLVLSISIVLVHSGLTAYGTKVDVEIYTGPLRPLVRLIVPMFFALSGYLVAGSLERSRTLTMFLGLRAIRIFPALLVEVILSAFILGPFVTSLPPHVYFSDPLFFRYLLNAFGDVHFFLPGVFENNPLPHVVNLQLWTVPFELYCYCTLAAIAWLGLKKRRSLGPFFAALIALAYLLVCLYRHYEGTTPGAMKGGLLVVTFLVGISIFFYKEMVPWNAWCGIAAIILSMVLVSRIPYGDFLAPGPIAYATVYLGQMNPNRKLLRGADYSYGIYLYGFAVQQTIVHLMPAATYWYVYAAIGIAATTLVAAASWQLVERPAGRLRPVLRRFEDRFLIPSQAPCRIDSAGPERGC